MCLPYTVEELRRTVHELQESHRSLDSTREALVKSEKLASMGQLTASIAHEVNNPLGILLLHANLLLEECAGGDPTVEGDLRLVVDQANRCKKIISGLLNFARQDKGRASARDLHIVVRDVLQTVLVDDGVTLRLDDRLADPTVELDADRWCRSSPTCSPTPSMPSVRAACVIALEGTEEDVSISVSDDGSDRRRASRQLFSPFFTTKQVGKNGARLGRHARHRQDARRAHQTSHPTPTLNGPDRHDLYHRPAAWRGGRHGGLFRPTWQAALWRLRSLRESSVLDPQRVTLDVVMVDDEGASCDGVRRTSRSTTCTSSTC